MSDYTEKNSNLIPQIDIPCFAWNSQAEQGFLFFKAKSLELEKLNKGFEELIKWDKMVAKSQKQNAENKQKFQNTKLDESFDAFDINQACDYIQDSYLEFRSLYLEQYERTGGNIDIKSLFSYVLRSGNQDMHKYCEFLFEKIGFIV